ncbi:MAG: hypothetical protein HY717_06860 [Planctomycetes bacterium]|nr:hypothetical protein [Planctomycetota bacterium]
MSDALLGEAVRPISLHPDNPHYFLFRGKPTILITSGEHYGAVLNLDFDYAKYLEALAAGGLNLTRTFSGAYVEPAGAFNIARNTLAPPGMRFIAPWARSGASGYAGGGNKFDLSRWDENYFQRLKDFAAQASQRGIVIEMNLFCPFYEDAQWRLSPQNAANNVNGLGKVARAEVYTLDKNGGLLSAQEAMVRKIVEELKGFDNVYYEICNEPYFGDVTLAWQHRIAEVIVETEKAFPAKHLISQNIANHSARIENPHPAVSIFNFHYASPPEAVAMNYALNKVIGDNETGFRGTGDAPYRMEGWDFIISGGGLYNNLDYSFTAGHEDGTFPLPPGQPGGGTPALRKQLKILGDFIHGFDFLKMKPDRSIITDGVPPGLTARALVQAGEAYAIYLRPLATPSFSARWTGRLEPSHSEEYTFYTLSNDGARLWVDGKLIIDDWSEHSEKESAGKIALAAGKKVPVKLEYFYNGGEAAMKLLWSSRSQPKEVVPASRFFLDGGGSERGLKGEYFEGTQFDRRRLSRTDAAVDFAWGTGSPFGAARPAYRVTLALELPAGAYQAEWIDPLDGAVLKREEFQHGGGMRPLASPRMAEDLALRVRRRK